MPKLTFAEFSKANEARKKQFFRDASEMWSIADALVACMGELGEVANALKKVRRAELGMLNKNAEGRQIDGMEQAKAMVAGEIGGFMCYLDQLCGQLGLRLEDCIVDEFNTKSKELDLPERIVDGMFLLAVKGNFFMGAAGKYKGEIYQEPEEEKPVTVSMKLDEDGDLYSGAAMGMDPKELAAEIQGKKYGPEPFPDIVARYRAAYPHIAETWEKLTRHVGKHPGLGAPYGEQPFNERGIVGERQHTSVPSLVVPLHGTDRTFVSDDFRRIERIQLGPEIYNFDEPITLESGVSYELGVNHDGQPFCRPAKTEKPDRPTVWHDGCAKCRFCCCELDGKPYCVEPSIKAKHPMGLDINAAVNDYCVKDGKLSLFEPRK